MKIKDIRRSTVSCVILSVIFVAFLLCFSLGTLFTDDREFSEIENRNLTQKPEVTTENVLSGDFDDEVEDYVSDQIFGKDLMMSLKTSMDYFSGLTLQNGVYFSSDGYLLQRYTENSEQISQNISYINSFADSVGVPADFILAPNSICVNSDKLPLGAVTDDQRETAASVAAQLSDSVTLFDAYDTVCDLQNNQGIQAYYRTDHHWTASAARAVCDAWLASAGYEGTGDNYQYLTAENFYGTLYSKAPAGFIQPDEFGYYVNPTAKYTVKYVKENTFAYSMMNTEYLKKKDKYSAFFGGNFSQIKISSDSKNKEKILVIKDSYANSLIPFLADSFSEVYVIDLRYFHFESASDLVKDNEIDRVLFVYNTDFLNEDQNFVWLE